jgi:hypothetical protein
MGSRRSEGLLDLGLVEVSLTHDQTDNSACVLRHLSSMTDKTY